MCIKEVRTILGCRPNEDVRKRASNIMTENALLRDPGYVFPRIIKALATIEWEDFEKIWKEVYPSRSMDECQRGFGWFLNDMADFMVSAKSTCKEFIDVLWGVVMARMPICIATEKFCYTHGCGPANDEQCGQSGCPHCGGKK